MSDQELETELLAHVPLDGSTIGSISLLRKLGWDDSGHALLAGSAQLPDPSVSNRTRQTHASAICQQYQCEGGDLNPYSLAATSTSS